MDRLDRLTQRLVEELEPNSCVGLALLEQFASGGLDSQARERVEAHLNDCLACLNRFVELRDYFHGIAAPGPVSSRLAQALDRLISTEPGEGFWPRIAETLRRALVFRIPAWAVAGAAAAILMTWTAAYKLQGPGVSFEWPFSDPASSARLKPARLNVPRTVSGVVSSIRDATSNGVEAHVVSLKDASGATYVLFAWGRPTVRPGDSVEIDGIFTSATQTAGLPVYQGVATELRRAR